MVVVAVVSFLIELYSTSYQVQISHPHPAFIIRDTHSEPIAPLITEYSVPVSCTVCMRKLICGYVGQEVDGESLFLSGESQASIVSQNGDSGPGPGEL